MRTSEGLTGIDEPRSGDRLGNSPWFTIDQAHVETCVDATDDWKWIHDDPERAALAAFDTTVELQDSPQPACGVQTIALVRF